MRQARRKQNAHRVDPAAYGDLLALSKPAADREHYCEEPGCHAWGSFSQDGSKSWFCRQHRRWAGDPA